MAKILIMSSAVYGHLAPLLSVARYLIGRGHDVAISTATAYERDVVDVGARFIPTYGPADFVPGDLAAERYALSPGPEQLNWTMKRAFIDPLPVQHAILQRELAAAGVEPVILVVDSYCLADWPGRLGAEGLRPAGTLAIGISVLTANSVDTGPFGFGTIPDTSPAGRAHHQELNAAARELMLPTQEHLQKVLTGLGTDRVAPYFFDGLATMPDRLLQLSPAGFEYPRSDLPVGVRFVGPIPARTDSPTALPGWWPDVVSAVRTIVVTQGTVANGDTSALFEPALRSLAGSDALVVVTTGGGVVLPDPPSGMRVADFIPFDVLMPHTDLLVTNGGFGGVLRALAHGVPLVVAGESEDKPDVNARVAWTGAGIDLKTAHPGDEDLRRAVDLVHTDPRYRDAAGRLQREIATHDCFSEIEAEIFDLLDAR